MDPSSSVGRTCLRENVIEILSDKGEGHGDWNSLAFQDTTNSGGKKEAKAMLKRGNKVVKKDLIVSLRGEIYFVKFIINLEEDDVKPGVLFGRSFLCLTKAIANFRNETIIIYPELDLFLVSSDEEEKISDDWDLLLDDLNFGDIPYIEGLIYSDIGPSMSTGTPLTQEEAEREAMAISIYERYSILEEERPVIEIMAYSDKYKKILNEICLDKMKFDAMNKEDEE
ncbi:hypothetical protein Tco_0044877 [Tanacetum coccineum]